VLAPAGPQPTPEPEPAAVPRPAIAAQAEEPATPLHPAGQIARAMQRAGQPPIDEMTASIGVMLERATDLGELREMLSAAFGTLDGRAALAEVIAGGIAAAQAAGMADAAEEAE